MCSPAPAAGAIRWSAIRPRCCATCATSCSRPQKAAGGLRRRRSILRPGRSTQPRRPGAAREIAKARGWTSRAEGPVARSDACSHAPRNSAMADHLSRRCRHRRHLHRHRAARRRRRRPHQEDLLERRATTPRRSSTACAEVFRETGLDRRRDRGDPPRHHGRLQRHPRAQGRARRADHHQGLPRRAGDPHAAHAAPLRHAWTKPPPLVERYLRQVVDERIDHRGPGRARARSGRRRARRRCAARREGRGDRRLPAQLVRQSGARADAEGDRRAQGAATCRCSISFEVLPEIKEYERTSTTVINAYVMPIVATLPAARCARASTTPASRPACC